MRHVVAVAVLGFGAAGFEMLGFGLGDFEMLGFGDGGFEGLGLELGDGDGEGEGLGKADASSEISGGLAQITGEAVARFVPHADALKISRPMPSRAPATRVR